ncbi:hypothetical protein ACFL7D_07670 [candidate division KSB1 bacterium]
MRKYLFSSDGFTFIQLIIVIVAIAIASTVAIKVTEQGAAKAKELETVNQIMDIYNALHGDVRLKNQTDFGFIGDLGRLPTSLDELLYDNGDPNWDGPYMSADFLEDNSNPFYDAWGNPLIYDNTTGQIGISDESTGGVPVNIPEPLDSAEEMLFGKIEGFIVDKYGNPPKKGHRRHILVFMEPIYDEDNWPTIVPDIERDMRIFHTERVWHHFHSVWNVLHVFTDPKDQPRDHWRADWRWARNDFMSANCLRTGNLIIMSNYFDGVNISNIWGSDIGIDKINIKWTRSRPSENITKIFINNVERWSGSVGSGNTIDIDDTLLPVGSSNVNLKFDFNSNLRMRRIEIELVMTDGSRKVIKRNNTDQDENIPPDEYDEDENSDDHEKEFDDWGRRRNFDPHFNNFWSMFFPPNTWEHIQDFLKVKVFIHPDRNGYFRADEVPVKPYIITCYHDLLEMSVKRYAIIEPGKTKKETFKFDTLFPGYPDPEAGGGDPGEDPGGGGETDDMGESLTVSGSMTLSGSNHNSIKLGNDDSQVIVIDKVKVSWSNSRMYERLERIKFGNTTLWQGNERSGATIDFQNFSIVGDASNIATLLSFNRNINNKNLQIQFIMSDNSVKDVN